MATSTPIAIDSLLQRYAAAKNAHDVDAILSLCSDDCRYATVGLGAPIRGKTALRAFYSALFEALPDYAGEFEGTAFGPDSAVVWGRFTGTSSAQFMGIEVEAGRRIEIPVTFVCQFRDGLVERDRGFLDTATLAEQLGVPLEGIRPGVPVDSRSADAASFVERFQQVWAHPQPDAFATLVTPDAVAAWPGLEPIRGLDYPKHIAGLLALAPDLRLDVTEHAEAGEVTFISWQAQATVNGQPLSWTGIDRFRLRDGRATEVLVACDTLPLLDAIRRSG
ncbi:MAG: nuclear transport factor 2 family protein [Actinomycetota bacterium]|nr:nuclear transport factor 2 family protein [Actinomycetota bacterium]